MPAPYTAADLGVLLGIPLQVPWFDVRDEQFLGGAKGDGVTDDTAAIQAAITAACAVNGTVVLPRPSSSYVVSSTLTIQPPGANTQVSMNFEAGGDFSSISYQGANGTSVFKSYGWKRSVIQGLQVRLSGSKTGVVVWDVDHDTVRGSTGLLDFIGCRVTTGGVATDCVGWRLGHSQGSELSGMNWYGCDVDWNSVAGTSIGWVNEDANGLNLNWVGCLATACTKGWTNTSTPGAFQGSGGDTMNFHSCGGTGNTTDFELGTGGTYLISGGRFELGHRFYDTGGSIAVQHDVTIKGVKLSGYNPGDGKVFIFKGSGSYTLEGVAISKSTATNFGANCIMLQSNLFATLAVRNCDIWATDPCYTNAQGTWEIVFDGCVQVDGATGAPIGFFVNPATGLKVLTYSASITPEASAGGVFKITATNGTAFTINAPLNPTINRRITFDIVNGSGGAMGAITWNAVFKLAGAFVNPLNTFRRTISFYYDGTNWVEINRAAADI